MHELRAKGLGDRPLVLGHRGAMALRPENTLASFRHALDAGSDALECDVHLSADGHLVVLHDETLDRTTDGTGPVSAKTLAELRALDAGSRFDPAYAGERLPTLAEVLDLARGRAPVVVEFKIAADPERVASAALALFAERDAWAEVAAISFDHRVIRYLKQRERRILTGALYLAAVIDPVGLARAALADGVMPNVAYLTPELAPTLAREGLWLGTWTANTDAEIAHALAMGAQLVGTNDPARLLARLGR